jgi:outer membrane protein assembly factor BamB
MTSARAADWPMFLKNANHLAVSDEALSVPMALEWKYLMTRFQNAAAPVVAGGTVYITGQSALYALDAATGEVKWTYPEEGPIGTPTAATIKASPVVWQDTVFVGASDGVLYAIDAKEGVLKWQFQTGGAIRFAPIVANDTVYLGSADNKLYGIDARTGKLAMEPIETGGDIVGSPAYADNLLFFTSADLQFYVANSSTGRIKYRLRMTNANLGSSPVVTDRYVYVVGGNTLMALLRSGTVRWTATTKNPISNTPLVTDNGVYVGDRGGRLYAFDLKGKEKWSITDNDKRAFSAPPTAGEKPKRESTAPEPFVQLGGAVNSSPVLSGTHIIVGSNRGFLYAIDEETGRVDWEYGVFSTLPAGSYADITGPPVVADGRLYVMADDGALHCFTSNGVDAGPPNIESETPLPATEMNGTPPILMGAIVSDEGSGINADTIKMTLDGNPVDATYHANTGWVTYRTKVTQPVEPLQEGRHTVTLTVSDWKGNTASRTWSFVIDNKLATSVIITPTKPPAQATQ